MGRGSKRWGDRAAVQQDLENKKAGRAGAIRTEDRGMLLPGIQEFQNSEGYSPTERADILGAGMDSLDSGQSVTRDRLLNSARRTRNSAGTNAAILSSGVEGAKAKSDLARGVTRSFADEKTRRRMFGLQQMAQLHGVDTDLLARLSGLPNQALQSGVGTIGKWGISVGKKGISYNEA